MPGGRGTVATAAVHIITPAAVRQTDTIYSAFPELTTKWVCN